MSSRLHELIDHIYEVIGDRLYVKFDFLHMLLQFSEESGVRLTSYPVSYPAGTLLLIN